MLAVLSGVAIAIAAGGSPAHHSPISSASRSTLDNLRRPARHVHVKSGPPPRPRKPQCPRAAAAPSIAPDSSPGAATPDRAPRRLDRRRPQQPLHPSSCEPDRQLTSADRERLDEHTQRRQQQPSREHKQRRQQHPGREQLTASADGTHRPDIADRRRHNPQRITNPTSPKVGTLNKAIQYLRSNAISLLALFTALGGTSYAALNLPAGSVGTRQLRDGSVTAKKLANGSITPIKFDPAHDRRRSSGTGRS